MAELHVGMRVRYRGNYVGRVGDDNKVEASLLPGIPGTVLEFIDDSPAPCDASWCTGADCDVCDGTGWIPPDPVWRVEWECPEGTTWVRLIRDNGKGWEEW